MQKGNIGVTTENIFPIIKKFLYSDHEIFLREIVSNAVDATQKLKTLSSMGEYKGELGDLTVRVSLNNDTITISDRGIGLTAEEIEKYIKNKESDDLIIRKYSTFCSKLEDKKVVDLSPLERIPCFHLRREIFINSSGEVCFCSYNYEKIIGDLKSETSSQIVEKMKKLYEKNALGQYEDRCKNCDDYYIFNF